MYIGELARHCGVSPKTIRHYEALGLLGTVRRAGIYRTYAQSDIGLVTLIRQGQALGFKLAELVFLTGEHPDWSVLERQIARKRADIASEVTRLKRQDRMLAQVLAEIHACPALDTGAADLLAACPARSA